MKLSKRPYVKRTGKIAMGVGDLGYCLVSNTVSSFIMYFGTAVAGMPGTLMGLAVAMGTVWDAVTDPLLGYVSDRASSKYFGRRHGFILLGIIGICIMNIMIWSVPINAPVILKFFWFAIGLILLESFNTFYATPNSALSIEISVDYNERSNIQGVKSVFYIIGMILPTLLMSFFQKPTSQYPDGRFNPQSYINFAYVASAVTMLFGLCIFVGTYSHIPRLRAQQEKEIRKKGKIADIFKGFFSILKKPNFRYIVLGYSVAMMAATFLISVGFHVFTYTFKTSTGQMYALMAGLFVMTIAGQPVWIAVSKKFDKKTTVLAGLSVSLAGAVLLFITFLFRDPINAGLNQNNPLAFILLFPSLMVAGLGTGVLYSMPLALIGDTITYEKASSKIERTATYTGFMTFAYKASQAVSQLLIGIMLDAIGFMEGKSIQTPKVESGLGWLLTIGCIASMLGGILIFSRYKLKKEDIIAAINKLEENTND